MRLYLTGGDDLYQLRYVAEEVLKKDLESTEGVAAIKVNGGYEEEIQVRVDEGKLALLGLGIEEVNDRLLRENVNQAGGSLYEEEARYLVRASNEFRDLDDILRHGHPDRAAGAGSTVGDVAAVTRGHKQREVITRFDGREAVELAIYKEGDANTVQVARSVSGRLERIGEGAARRASRSLTGVDQSRFIRASIREVLSQRSGRRVWSQSSCCCSSSGTAVRTLIVGVSIPISIVATFFLMYRTGTTLNIMSLGGLALGVGMLVDNAIVVLESIFRRREQGLSALEAAPAGRLRGRPGGDRVDPDHGRGLPAGGVPRGDRGAALPRHGADRVVLADRLAGRVADLDPDAGRARGPAGTATARSNRRLPAARWRRVLRMVFVVVPSLVLSAVRWLLGGLIRVLTLLGRPVSAVFDWSSAGWSRGYPRLLEWALDHRPTVLAVVTAAVARLLRWCRAGLRPDPAVLPG